MARRRTTKKGRKSRQWRYEQSVPIVLGGMRATQRASVSARWLLLPALVVIIGGLALWFAASPRFYVRVSAVEGAQRVSGEEVREIADIEGKHILRLNARDAAARVVQTIPSVQGASVVCRLPADCVIRVQEAPVVATWQVGQDVLLVDAVGAVFAEGEAPEDVWRLSGPIPLDGEGRVREAVLIALAELESLGVRPRPVAYRPGRGLVFEDEMGWRVILGEGSGMARRLEVYRMVKDYLLQHDIHPRFVDVRFPDAPYYSETNEW